MISPRTPDGEAATDGSPALQPGQLAAGSPTPVGSLDPSRCPLCHRANSCQLCTVDAYKGSCWCVRLEIPESLLARVPPDLRNKTCLCRECVMNFHRAQAKATAATGSLPSDYYWDSGRLVFTASYHRRRGYCCENDCRHCPYPQPVRATPA